MNVLGFVSNHRYLLGEKYPGIHLSKREAECVLYLLRGKSLKGIGSILQLSHRTIESLHQERKKKIKNAILGLSWWTKY